MTLWIVLTLLTSAVAVALAIPVIRRFEAPITDQDRLLQVSRDQLAEIEADLARGNLAERDAAEARAEIERRVLTVAKTATAPLKPTTSSGRTWALVAVTGWVVAGATGIYALVGRPDLPSQPTAATAVAATDQTAAAATDTGTGTAMGTGGAAMGTAAGTGSVEEAIASLIARLEKDPNDAEGWRMLGWSYFNTERYAEASEAYGKAVKLDGSLPEVWSAYGETLVRSARGMVTEDAIAAFDSALKVDPNDPRARFFKGMALEQAGDAKAAIESWIELASSAPAGADWLPGVITRIDELAAATNYDLGTKLDGLRTAPAADLPPTGGLAAPGAAAEPGPTAADVAAAGQMTPEDRQAMIQGMVDQLAARLADNPDDPAGWAKLIKSRMVMQDAEGAATALSDAKAAVGDAPEKWAIVAEAARAAGLAVE